MKGVALLRCLLLKVVIIFVIFDEYFSAQLRWCCTPQSSKKNYIIRIVASSFGYWNYTIKQLKSMSKCTNMKIILLLQSVFQFSLKNS